MYRGNATQSYKQNPYFDGVTSAITTQGEVTVNVRSDRWEIEERRKIAGSNKQTRAYPGGESWDNLHVYPHELVFGWTHKKARFNFPGQPNEIGFSSLNGIYYGKFGTDEELMDNLYLIGLAKTPYVFDNLDQLKHGFTAIRVGSGTTFHTGTKDIYAGDLIEWSVIPRPAAFDPNFPSNLAFTGGEFGGNRDPRFGTDRNLGGRQGNPRQGTPRGKFRFIVNPVVRGDMQPGLNGAISKMLKPIAQGGISDMPVEALFAEHDSQGRRFTSYQEYAKGTLMTDIVGAMRVIEVLLEKNYLQAGAALQGTRQGRAIVLDLLERTGAFRDSERVPQDVRDIINNLYLGYSANADQSSMETIKLRATVPEAFAQNGSIKQERTVATRYARMAYSYGDIRQGTYDKAVFHKRRRIIGMALAPSSKGQRLDILLGHFRI